VNNRLFYRPALAMVVTWIVGGTALCQPERETPQIRVTGRATVSAQPERADVDIGVVTEAKEAQQAARLNADKLDAVRKAVIAAVGRDTKLETVDYSLQPVYRRQPEPKNEPTVSSYIVTNVLRVRELELTSVGKVIDAATDSGANTVSNIRFGLRDEEEVKTRALREAAVNARSKVDTLAAALGVRVGRILTVIEGEPDIIRPMPAYRGEMVMAQAASPTTPIEPNAIEIRASVTLVVEIAP
jgi:uncharacterized protein